MSRVKRIEVLNGAASSLYGSDAIAGVINIITNQPKDEISFTTNSRYTRKNQFSQGRTWTLPKQVRPTAINTITGPAKQWPYRSRKKMAVTWLKPSIWLSIGYSIYNFSQHLPTMLRSLALMPLLLAYLTDRPANVMTTRRKPITTTVLSIATNSLCG